MIRMQIIFNSVLKESEKIEVHVCCFIDYIWQHFSWVDQ